MTSVKRPGSLLFCSPGLAGLLGLLLSGGCGPMVDRAPFTARPEGLGPGDLLGPFEGTVVDSETERPVEGAMVSGSWAFERGVGLVGPQGAFEVTLETDSDGRYRVKRLPELPPGPSSRVARFTLIVYKRGYVGWRSDTLFPAGARRHDFSQRGNRVRLERWPEDGSHAQHLVFLGGGSKIQRVSAWEREPASLELEGRRAAAPGPAGAGPETALTREPMLLDASSLLSEEELRGVTGYAGEFEKTRLADRPRTEFYDTVHFAAKGREEQYDVALRVFRLGEAAAVQQFRELIADLPAPEARDEVGDTSVRVRAGGVRALVFLLRDRGLVGSVTCGEAQCTEPQMVVRIGKLIESRMDALPVLPASPPAGSSAPSEPGDGIADPFEQDPSEGAETPTPEGSP